MPVAFLSVVNCSLVAYYQKVNLNKTSIQLFLVMRSLISFSFFFIRNVFLSNTKIIIPRLLITPFLKTIQSFCKIKRVHWMES